MTADVAAPTADLILGGNTTFFGSAMIRHAMRSGRDPRSLLDESSAGCSPEGTGGGRRRGRWRGSVAP